MRFFRGHRCTLDQEILDRLEIVRSSWKISIPEKNLKESLSHLYKKMPKRSKQFSIIFE